MTDEQDFSALEELEQDLKTLEAFLKKEEPKAAALDEEPEVELPGEPSPVAETPAETPKKKAKAKAKAEPKAEVVKEEVAAPAPASAPALIKAEKKVSAPVQPLYGAARIKAKLVR